MKMLRIFINEASVPEHRELIDARVARCGGECDPGRRAPERSRARRKRLTERDVHARNLLIREDVAERLFDPRVEPEPNEADAIEVRDGCHRLFDAARQLGIAHTLDAFHAFLHRRRCEG